MRTKRELLAGEWAVLALLCEGPAHGYAVAAAMAPDGEIGKIWSLGQALTYRALTVLQQLELVEVVGVKPGNRAPRRTELKATPAARRMVRRWLHEPERRIRDMRPYLLLKLHLLQRARRSAQPLLRAQRELLLATLAELDARLAQEPPEPDALLARWRRTMADAALAFVDDAIVREQAPPPARRAAARA